MMINPQLTLNFFIYERLTKALLLAQIKFDFALNRTLRWTLLWTFANTMLVIEFNRVFKHFWMIAQESVVQVYSNSFNPFESSWTQLNRRVHSVKLSERRTFICRVSSIWVLGIFEEEFWLQFEIWNSTLEIDRQVYTMPNARLQVRTSKSELPLGQLTSPKRVLSEC